MLSSKSFCSLRKTVLRETSILVLIEINSFEKTKGIITVKEFDISIKLPDLAWKIEDRRKHLLMVIHCLILNYGARQYKERKVLQNENRTTTTPVVLFEWKRNSIFTRQFKYIDFSTKPFAACHTILEAL